MLLTAILFQAATSHYTGIRRRATSQVAQEGKHACSNEVHTLTPDVDMGNEGAKPLSLSCVQSLEQTGRKADHRTPLDIWDNRVVPSFIDSREHPYANAFFHHESTACWEQVDHYIYEQS